MSDKTNGINWLPPRDSNPDMLIQSQQVTLTGTDAEIYSALQWLKLDLKRYGVTVTLMPTSVTDPQGSVTAGVPNFSRNECDECDHPLHNGEVCGWVTEGYGFIEHECKCRHISAQDGEA